MNLHLTCGTQRRPQWHGQGPSGIAHPARAAQGRSGPGGSPGKWSPGRLLWGSRAEQKLLHCTQAHGETWGTKQATLWEQWHGHADQNNARLSPCHHLPRPPPQQQPALYWAVPVNWKQDIVRCCMPLNGQLFWVARMRSSWSVGLLVWKRGQYWAYWDNWSPYLEPSFSCVMNSELTNAFRFYHLMYQNILENRNKDKRTKSDIKMQT
jgi:hypothetical protein